MIRNLKALSLALVAVFAMSALVASAAQAKFPAFLTTAGVTIDGEQEGQQVFTANGRTVTCETATFMGGAPTNEGKTLAITPSYSNCHSVILGVKHPATVTLNGCSYLFHGTKDESGTYTALADLVCPAGSQIEVHVYNNATTHAEGKSLCTITIPANANNTGLSTIDLTNKTGTPDDITADIEVTGITAELHPEGLVCGETHTTTATLSGFATLRATNALGEFVNLTVSG